METKLVQTKNNRYLPSEPPRPLGEGWGEGQIKQKVIGLLL